MSDQDAFDQIRAALYDAMLDDARWPAASAQIDEACGLAGNTVMVGEGPEDDVRALESPYPVGQRPSVVAVRLIPARFRLAAPEGAFERITRYYQQERARPGRRFLVEEPFAGRPDSPGAGSR